MEFKQTWNDFFPHWSHPIRIAGSFSEVLGPGPRDSAEAEFARSVEQAEKVELHTHLESSVSASFYAQLNAQQGLFAPDELPALRTPHESWQHFSDAWFDNTRLITREEQLVDMVVDFAEQRARQNIIYAESHISPLHFTAWRKRDRSLPPPLRLREVLQAYLEGVRRAQERFPRHVVRLLVDAPWTSHEEDRAELLSELQRLLPTAWNRDLQGLPIIVGVGVADREIPGKAESLTRFLAGCRELGLLVDVHTGELFGSEVHRATLAHLQPDRLSHLMNGYLPELLSTERPVNFCPLASVYVGDGTKRLAQHPIRAFYEALEAGQDLRFSVSCDDPLLFSLNLTLEFVALRRAFGWGERFFSRCMDSSRQSVFSAQSLAAAGAR